jgi:hypothetical protein
MAPLEDVDVALNQEGIAEEPLEAAAKLVCGAEGVDPVLPLGVGGLVWGPGPVGKEVTEPFLEIGHHGGRIDERLESEAQVDQMLGYTGTGVELKKKRHSRARQQHSLESARLVGKALIIVFLGTGHSGVTVGLLVLTIQIPAQGPHLCPRGAAFDETVE